MDLKRSDKIFLGALLCFVVLTLSSIYSMNVKSMKPHVEEFYVMSYKHAYDVATNVSITNVLARYNVANPALLETDDYSVIMKKKDIKMIYGGHYDFETGQLYNVSSEGELGWLYRKITMFEILDHDTCILCVDAPICVDVPD